MRLIQFELNQKDGVLMTQTPISPQFPSPSTPPSPSTKISPIVLFIIVILAVIFFICGTLHLFVKFLLRKRSSSSTTQSSTRYPDMNNDAFDRQLQQLFQLHDSGLDQAFIDALPVFLYKEIMGLKEPFDCAVCLCEFSQHDNLRLLPLCGHAFHIDCIDTWLLSNSTCPLCRGTLFAPGFTVENPVFEFDDSIEQDGFPGSANLGVSCNNLGVSCTQKANEDENLDFEKRVLTFPVRLGKFRNTNDDCYDELGETSNGNLDSRRCFSMGSFQYVVDSSELQVAYCPNRGKDKGSGGNDEKVGKGRQGQFGNLTIDEDVDEKRINTRSKGESFSVSKIWLWSKKGKFTSSSSPVVNNSSIDVSLPWNSRN